MKIYTKGGDKGMTSLATGVRVRKTDLRLEAYGTADELNSFVGLLRSKLSKEEDAFGMEWIQNKLFNLGAMLAGAPGSDWITEEHVRQLEQWIDQMQAGQEPLRAFVLPGGDEVVSLSHVCRTITRRLERNMVACIDENQVDPQCLDVAMRFVNRLSDFWFVFGLNLAKNREIALFLWKK